MTEPFFATIKLITGEEVLSEVFITEENGVEFVVFNALSLRLRRDEFVVPLPTLGSLGHVRELLARILEASLGRLTDLLRGGPWN